MKGFRVLVVTGEEKKDIMIFALICSACQGDTQSDNKLPAVIHCYVTIPANCSAITTPFLTDLVYKISL